MKKIYHLSNCNTCQRIIDELNLTKKDFIFQDIKTEKITEKQLLELKKLTGSYETIFSKIARKYRDLELNTKTLTEEDFKNYILQEYTFLKRPVIIIDKKVFVGNSKSTVLEAKKLL